MKTRAKAAAPVPRRAPRQQRSAQTVAAIVEAAAQIIETGGLEGFNTNTVAARAGVSVGSLYQYFRDKDALLVALSRREKDRFYDDGARAAGAATAREALEILIEAGVRQQLARPRLARLLDVEETRPEIAAALSGGRSLHGIVVALLSRDDVPRLDRIEQAAWDIGAILRGLTDTAGERGETDLVDLYRRIDAAVLGYLENIQRGEARRRAAKRATAKNASNSSRSSRKRAQTTAAKR